MGLDEDALAVLLASGEVDPLTAVVASTTPEPQPAGPVKPRSRIIWFAVACAIVAAGVIRYLMSA